MPASDIAVVPVDRCRHYCGFRYGCGSFNPYENYIVGLHEGTPAETLRRQFEDFFRYYRPRDLGEALGIRLSRRLPLWIYPWDPDARMWPYNGWVESPDDVPDIMTHFCEQGIRRSRIEQEMFWLKRAYATMSTEGYRPQEPGRSWIEVMELRRGQESVYIVRDGNHRLGALAALGVKEVAVRRWLEECRREEDRRQWVQVRDGTCTPEDAMSVFDAYFKGVDGFPRAPEPATILEA